MIHTIPKWKAKPKMEDGFTSPNFLGVTNEVLRDEAGAAEHITIEVRGLAKFPSGTYKLAFVSGASLGDYLKRVKLRYAGMTNAVYDYTNLEKGRCRMSYIPQKGARIVIGRADMGPAFQFQRTTADGMRLAANMGKASAGQSPNVVEVKLK